MTKCTVCRRRFAPARSDAATCSNRCRQKRFRQRHKPESPHAQWGTPRALFADLDREFKFDLDACAAPWNAKCSRFFTRQQDALQHEWRGRVFMNPPYGRGLARWVAKAHELAQQGARIVCLLPAFTESAWWHRYVVEATDVRFLRGRLKFESSPDAPKYSPRGGVAPFGCAVVVFTPPATNAALAPACAKAGLLSPIGP